MITCGEIIESKKTVPVKSTSNKTVPTNFNEETVKLTISVFYLPFY